MRYLRGKCPHAGVESGEVCMREIKDGDSIIGVVSQVPFESPSPTGIHNAFCTLQPIALEDGGRTEPEQFPNCGLVWWMLVGIEHRFAQPGRLVSFTLELAPEFNRDAAEKHQYQVRRGSIKPSTTTEIVEILNVSRAVSRQNDLVSVASCTVDHPPCDYVLVRWRDNLYGPLRTKLSEGSRSGEIVVGFTTAPSGPQALRLPASELDKMCDAGDRVFEVDVALDSLVRNRSDQAIVCSYELIPAAVYRQLTHSAEHVRLESDAAILRSVAKDLFGWNRKQRQELNRLLGQFGEELALRQEYSSIESVTGVLSRARSVLDGNETLAGELADALIASGVVDQAVEEGIDERFKNHVESRTAKIASDIQERVASEREKLKDLVRKRDEFESALRTVRADFDRELDAERDRHRVEIEEERAALEREKEQLIRKRQAVEKQLEAVTARFVSARDDVVGDLLALAPFLNLVGFPVRPETPPPTEAPALAPGGRQEFKLRRYLSKPLAGGEITEIEFFERFKRHVEASGFVYDRQDLATFHVSLKVSDLTVLGGVSGTGKSSLPRLYAQALAGDVCAWDDRFRMVGVNPSWLDVGDLLGRVNVLDACFLPSDSGLYDLLIHAHEEFERQKRNSGMYIVCLDEMNLAQVEHYFSPFLQALEAPPDHRQLRCFAPESVSADSDFARWATVSLPPSLRFVGTVNFDETTRPLSLRVLDRVNRIELSPSLLNTIDPSVDQSPAVPVMGPPVTHGVFESWRRPGQAGPVADLLDKLRHPLGALGCPLSPRRYRAVCQFLASAPAELLTPEEAFDMQITQRLLPQIRGLFRQAAQDAVDEIRSLLGRHGDLYSRSLRALDALRSADDPGLSEPRG